MKIPAPQDSIGDAPRLDAPALARSQETVADIVNPRFLHSQETMFEGYVWDVVREEISLTEDSEPFRRDYLAHWGAVAVAALNEKNQILLINQYRHPVRMNLWEIPAGLLDMEGEEAHLAAARELAEEADLRAETWNTLCEFHMSPGGSAESMRIYLARNLSEIPREEQEERREEEAEIVTRWVDLDEAVEAVLSGRIHNPAATHAILAVDAAARRNFDHLKPADTPWAAHPYLRDPNYRGETR